MLSGNTYVCKGEEKRRGKSTLPACSPCSPGAQLTLLNSSTPQVVASGIRDSPEGPGRKGMRLWGAYPLLADRLPPPGRSDAANTSHNVGREGRNEDAASFTTLNHCSYQNTPSALISSRPPSPPWMLWLLCCMAGVHKRAQRRGCRE